MQKAETKTRHFTDLFAWQKAHILALEIYKETKKFPVDERFGLTSQMRRSATSIKANIAERFGRQTNPDKIQFYIVARGSNTELQDQLLTARDLGYIMADVCEKLTELAVVVNKIINGLIRSIRTV